MLPSSSEEKQTVSSVHYVKAFNRTNWSFSPLHTHKHRNIIVLTFLASRLFLRTPDASSCNLPLRASSTSIQPRRPEEIQSFQKDV